MGAGSLQDAGVMHSDGLHVGDDGLCRGVVGPVGVGLQHSLDRGEVAGLCQKLKTDGCLPLPFGSVREKARCRFLDSRNGEW